jgi:serine protease SohB
MKRWIPFLKSAPVVSVVRVVGVIATGGRSSTINEENLSPYLEKAFVKGAPKAVALSINCPGGSPVQSSLIGAKIKYLSNKHKVPVYAFVEDVAASGGYWIACCADEIYVDDSSILGSIGVISASFGFNKIMEKQGIERRVHTSGTDKSMLDPFRPEKPSDIKRLKELQKQIHETFIEHVKNCRSSKLSDDKDLFTGEIWIGKKAIDVGLVDGIGHLKPFFEKKYGKKVKINIFGGKKSILQRFGAKLLANNIDELNYQALWNRFGL